MIRIQDEGIILSIKKFQESFLLVRCFCKDHGIIPGLIRRNKQSNEIIPGNYCTMQWNARLREHLGFFKFEILQNTLALIIAKQHKVIILNSITSIIPIIINEKEAQPEVFNAFKHVINNLIHNYNDKKSIIDDFRVYLNFELSILNKSGYGKIKNLSINCDTTESLIETFQSSENFIKEYFLHHKNIKMPTARNFLVDYLVNMHD